MTVNEVFKNHIEMNGIKQVFVAERAGIPPELLRRSLEGQRKIPADEFIRLCLVLKLDLKDFTQEA